MIRLGTTIAAIAASSAAFAVPVVSSAVLVGPARTAQPVTDAGVWRCNGTSCTGMANTVPHETIAVCTGIADRAGRVAAFTIGDRTLGDDQIAQCNRHLERQVMATTHAPFSAEALASKTGLELIQGMVDGTLPGAPIARLMNMAGIEAGPGVVVFSGQPTRDHYNPQGTVHGGYAATLLDSCMGCAVSTTLPAGTGFTTIDINVTYVRAMTDATGTVFARGEVINSGRRVATVRGTLTDANGKLLAHGTSSCLVFPL